MNDARRLFEEAVGCLQRKEYAQAESKVRAILGDHPKHPDALSFLAVIFAEQKRLDEAAEVLEECLRINANNPAALTNMGEVLRLQGRVEDALARLRHALLIAPGFVEAHYNLGVALKQAGDDEAAVAAYRRALELQPNHTKARFNLANTLRDQGRTPMAAVEYERVIAQRPDWFDARLNYGAALSELGRSEEALAEYRVAHSLDPTKADVATNIGDVYAKQGRIEEAKEWLRKNLDRYPDKWLRQLHIDSLAENVPPDNASIDGYRAGLTQRIAELSHETLTLQAEGLSGSGAEPPMTLQYQGRDDRAIRDAYGDLFAKLIEPLEPLRPEGKPHIGIVVTNGHEGVFYRCLGSLIERLDRSKLRVTVICSLAGRNVLRHMFFKKPQEYLMLPPTVDGAAKVIRDARFHLLLYWEVGTDSMNYFLPYFRPAPVQSATWGWPVTTGNPRMDYFVSARGLEPEDGASHYRERLVVLDSVPTFYLRPPVPSALKGRESFGLPTAARLYLCAQNLRKYHPDFDAALAEILRADPEGLILMIADEQPTIGEKLLKRLGRGMPDVKDRLRLLPRMEREDYLNVLALADVNLDTFYYGSGANTMYDTIATGTPIVTMPWRFHRGRYTLGTLERIGWQETITHSVDDYVKAAIRLGTDRDFRESASECLRSEPDHGVLESDHAVRAHEEFFLRAAAGDV